MHFALSATYLKIFLLGENSKSFPSETISKYIITNSKLPQWRNTNDVLFWLKNLEDKDNLHFIGFDIVNFHQSLTESLLMKALTLA